MPGTPAQPYYYGVDQIGSVRRVFSSSGAPAYSYDPYGSPLQGTAPVTDFGYAGMVYNADSGLYLTQYRAYDPTIGRWLSRDPLGEASDPAANLYRYADGNPVSYVDPNGRQSVPGVIVGAFAGGTAGYIADGWKGAAIGVFVGGGVGVVVPWASAAAATAVTGDVAGFFASTGAFAGVSGLAGAGGTVAANLAEGCNWSNGVASGFAIGAASPLLSGEAPIAAMGGAAKIGLTWAWDAGFSAYTGTLGIVGAAMSANPVIGPAHETR